jgi:DNA-binding transcriptional ArsR family regulator
VSGSPAPAFHEVIHAPVRLRICGLLRPVDELEFAVLRDALELKDANLSKNLKVLAEAGLVRIRKEGAVRCAPAHLGRADHRRACGLRGAPGGPAQHRRR